jgi:hypothetical protein
MGKFCDVKFVLDASVLQVLGTELSVRPAVRRLWTCAAVAQIFGSSRAWICFCLIFATYGSDCPTPVGRPAIVEQTAVAGETAH